MLKIIYPYKKQKRRHCLLFLHWLYFSWWI